MKKKYIIATIIVLLLVAAAWGIKEYNRERADSKSLKPKFTVTAASILDEFSTNEGAASTKYAGLDVVIAVTGRIKEVSKDNNGYYTVLLGDNQTASSVRCLMDTLYSKNMGLLHRGTIIKIKGNFNGYKADELGIGADLEMNFCVVDSPLVK
jgi:hypothetical protein